MEPVEAAVGEWLRQNAKHGWDDSVVPGATDAERARLFALGGFVNPVVYPAGKKQVEGWPAEVLAWTSAPEPPVDLAKRLRAAAASSHEVLSRIYERTVTASSRRRLGTFFTPAPLVIHMFETAERLLGQYPQLIVDPGAGVGAFSVPAVDRWRCDAVAVDVNPVTLGLLGVASALRGQTVVEWAATPARSARRVHLAHADYLRWVGPFLQSSHRRPALVLGNPPYTRHQSLGPAQKTDAARLSGDLVSSTLAGLSTYFLAVTLRHLRADDSVVMLLPSNWLTTRYAQEIRAHLWGLQTRRTELHVFPTELEVFPGTQVAAVVLGLGPRMTSEQPLVVTAAHLSPTTVEMQETHIVTRAGTVPPDFSRLAQATEESGPLRSLTRRVTLGDIAVVRRGVATGANARYFLTDRAVGRLPQDAVAPAIVRLRGFEGDDLTRTAHDALGAQGARRWLVDFHAYRQNGRTALPVQLRTFIDDLESDGIHLRHLLSVRGATWWVPEAVAPAQILIGPMTKGSFRIVKNSVGAVHSNTLYGVSLRNVDPTATEVLHRWLEGEDGQARLAQVARRHATGLLKLEPRALKGVEVPRSTGLAG